MGHNDLIFICAPIRDIDHICVRYQRPDREFLILGTDVKLFFSLLEGVTHFERNFTRQNTEISQNGGRGRLPGTPP